jgi:hypothetical protein
MQPFPPSDTQRRAATAVGAAYLAAIPLALFAEFYVRGTLLVNGDSAATSQNILEHVQLFRLGIASSVLVFAVDVLLVAGLYLALKPVSHGLALTAAFFRLVETAVILTVALDDLAVLRVLAAPGAQAMVEPSIAAHPDAYGVGLFFAGIGSTLFCSLWYVSRYIPRPLAAIGVVASVLMAARELGVIISPELGRVVSIAYYGGPILIFELVTGIWLLLVGLRAASIDPVAKV